ncbi:MAG: histone deacetylase [Desulfovibrio sp.]|jgi:acetoin utilization deacetylase AcuC-like enzyme|nr:histone deacetylase [Desulfovibrio sp.]
MTIAEKTTPGTPKSVRTLGLVFFPAYDWAITPDHPEREERLLYTQDQLREEGLFDIAGISEHRPDMGLMRDVSRVHFCPPGFDAVVETPHLASAGSAVSAGRLVAGGRTQKAFALTRPPGHHAMKVVQGGRGFCAVNIEAIMIERLRREYGIRRVAIVDTDCHHGDGTQDIYWHDPHTLFISLHQDGRTLYPGTGFSTELGGPGARGATINVPLPPQTGDEGFLYVMKHLVRPILDHWRPDLVINSAGQDNHFTDPITDMRLSARGYARMVELLNPDIAVLEGGYSIQGALPYVNLAVILALAGMDYSHVIEPLWHEELARTAPKSMDYIGELCEKTWRLYEHTHTAPHDYTKSGYFWTRERSVYYDTDGIREHQREEVRDCSDCPGLLVIQSTVDYRTWSVCLHLPLEACPTCRAEAEERRRQAIGKKQPVEYSDRDQDVYERS